jgi:membrane-associated phospholipid phosphatase
MAILDLKKGNQRLTLIVLLVSLMGFSLTVLLRSSFSAIDASANSWSTSIHSPLLTQIAIVIDYAFDTVPMLILSLATAGYLFYEKRRGYALLLVGAMLGDVALLVLFRALIYSPRPSDSLIVVVGSSFPSGHVMGTVVLFGLLTYFAWRRWGSSAAKSLSGTLYLAIVLIVGFDRIYLNVHWFSDVLGAYLLGIFLVALSILILERPTDFQPAGKMNE